MEIERNGPVTRTGATRQRAIVTVVREHGAQGTAATRWWLYELHPDNGHVQTAEFQLACALGPQILGPKQRPWLTDALGRCLLLTAELPLALAALLTCMVVIALERMLLC